MSMCSVAWSCLTLCDPIDCSLSSSSAVEYFRQEYWSGFPFPPPGDFPNPWIKPRSPALQVDSLLFELPCKPYNIDIIKVIYYVYFILTINKWFFLLVHHFLNLVFIIIEWNRKQATQSVPSSGYICVLYQNIHWVKDSLNYLGYLV